MPKRTEYCVAFQQTRGDGVVHRAWTPRKADAVLMARAIHRLGAQMVGASEICCDKPAWENVPGVMAEML